MVVASVMRLGCWMPPLAMWWRWWSQWIPCGPPGPGALVDNRKMRKSLARTWSFSHPFLFPMFLYFLWMFAIVFHHFLDPFLKHSFFLFFFAIVFHFFSSWCLNHFWSISVGFLDHVWSIFQQDACGATNGCGEVHLIGLHPFESPAPWQCQDDEKSYWCNVMWITMS